MAEYNILVMDRMIEYTGLFDLPGLIKLLDRWFKERGYDKRETKNYEEVYEDHRQVTIEMLPYKKISDNVKFEMRLFMIFKNLQETEVEKDGKKVKLMKGTAQIFMDAYHEQPNRMGVFGQDRIDLGDRVLMFTSDRVSASRSARTDGPPASLM